MTEKIDWKIIVSGIAALTIIEAIALFNGIDSTLTMAIAGLIGLAIGVTLPNPIKQ